MKFCIRLTSRCTANQHFSCHFSSPYLSRNFSTVRHKLFRWPVSQYISPRYTRSRESVITFSVHARKESTMASKEPFQRLPTDVKPMNYDISLTPNLKSFTFQGTEDISVEVGHCLPVFPFHNDVHFLK